MTVDGFSVEDVSLIFGGITALDSLSFDVPKGMVCGLIGPNGAGKTTLFNCASGIYAPSTGRMTFDGTNLLALKAHRMSKHGVARTFQNVAEAERGWRGGRESSQPQRPASRAYPALVDRRAEGEPHMILSKQVVYTPGDVAPVRFDPEIAAALEEFHKFQLPGAFTMETIPAIRRGLAEMTVTDSRLLDAGVVSTREVQIPGMPGDPDVTLLVCRPSAAEGPTPALFYTHGGGMVIGDNRTGLAEMIDYALELQMSIVSVEYRLAPEHPHPAPVNDCFAGLLWVVEHASDLGIDSSRVIVAGSSAGGGLAAAMSLLARDRGGADLLGQMLICPMLDDRNDSVSAQQIVDVGTWDRNSNETGWSALLGEGKGREVVSPYAAPARADDLSGLPPAFIDVGSAETFRDEDVEYATRIWQAGGIAELHVWPGGCHGFDIVAPNADISRKAKAARLAWLRRMIS